MYKILIVEDDELVAEIYQGKIEAEGYTVEVAYNGLEGYEKLKQFRPDLLLLDMMMPVLSGGDLLLMVRSEEEFKSLPVIAFTNTDSQEVVADALRMGATKVLSKGDYKPNQIVARLTEILAALPKAPKPEAALWQSVADWTPPSGRVLVADDDPVMMSLVKDVLEEEGYTVVTACDGREAYKILGNDNDFLAGLFDVRMPHIQGPDLVRHMQSEKRLRKIPVLIMTGEQGLGVQSESFAAGAALFIPKPFTRATLRTMFRALGVRG